MKVEQPQTQKKCDQNVVDRPSCFVVYFLFLKSKIFEMYRKLTVTTKVAIAK